MLLVAFEALLSLFIVVGVGFGVGDFVIWWSNVEIILYFDIALCFLVLCSLCMVCAVRFGDLMFVLVALGGSSWMRADSLRF